MGSSNMGVETTVDVEAQRHSPNWFVDHTHMLRPNQKAEENKLGYFISKVPESKRQPPQDFSPDGWRFGLHNRESLDSNGTEAVKLGVALQYGLVGEKWVHFRDVIVDDPKAMLACYGLLNEVTSWTDEQIKHVLALDALFLASLFDIQLPRNEQRLWRDNLRKFQYIAQDVFFERYNMWGGNVGHDLFKVENQIPLVLIDKVVEYISNFDASPTSEGNELRIGDLQYQRRHLRNAVKIAAICFMAPSAEAFKIDNPSLFCEKKHILEATYNAICGSEGLLMKRVTRSSYIHVPSATKLDQSRIKIVGVDGPLCRMSYNNSCLSLPKMRIYDDTTSFLRNMAYYEYKRIPGGCLFNDYMFLMFDLIEAPQDVDLLIERGVIDNACGARTFGMWIALRKGTTQISSSKRHNDMKEAIVKRCHCRRYRLWNEFNIAFCSKPWLVLSTIAVVLVTMATLVQTYISVIGSNKMKPKFP